MVTANSALVLTLNSVADQEMRAAWLVTILESAYLRLNTETHEELTTLCRGSSPLILLAMMACLPNSRD